ncbi:MAG: amidophosphoribosyltransferase [Betaproteobacteria bacterium]|nr:amidophosphoribosyltransferase [Betaproteobacteria bacterium]
MCGIIGIAGSDQAGLAALDGLRYLQHRGQDAVGVAALNGKHFSHRKQLGMIDSLKLTGEQDELAGNLAIGHVRYTTSGRADSGAEIQPLYVNSPFGICLAHNGNLPERTLLTEQLSQPGNRHINSDSDSELALNLLADELKSATRPDPESLFAAVGRFHERFPGAYAIVALIVGGGMLAFRDPNGIRPLCIGSRKSADGSTARIAASESAAITGLGFTHERSLAPGEAVLFGEDGSFQSRQCAPAALLRPCLIEYVYFARPDSILDGALVYQTRVAMGRRLAERARRKHRQLCEADVVIPVPDSSRHAALEFAHTLGIPYREGLVRNKFIGRSFILSSQSRRRSAVRRKLSVIESEFAGRKVILVDDSIVRGTTCREIVALARQAGAAEIHVVSTAPPVLHPNFYGIDMPTTSELIAHGRSIQQVADLLGADSLTYQDLADLQEAVRESSDAAMDGFDASCFDGHYVTGDIGGKAAPAPRLLKRQQAKARAAA